MDKLIGFVLRHGETNLNKEKCFRSWIDVPLDENGVAQAKEAAKFLKDYPIRAIVSSPLLRAFVTAVIVAKPHKLFVSQHRGLFPWRLGVFSGLSRDDNQDALRLFVQNPNVCVPGGESLVDFEKMQFTFWKAALEQAHKEGLTLYVAHTSNVVSLENFTTDEKYGEPELGSESVMPGGVAAIYWNGNNHRIEPVFGGVKPAKFGGS